MRPRIGLSLALAALVLPAPAAAAPSPAVQFGKRLYGQYCVACHGANGSGITKSSRNRVGGGPSRSQTQEPGLGPPLRGVGALAPDFYLRTGYMPLQRVGLQPRRSRVLLSEQQITALISYVASLGPGPSIPSPDPKQGDVSRGLKLFTDNCAGCHQVVAEGGYVTGAVAPPLEDATARQVAEAVRIGPYVMPRFSPKQISNADLNSIVAYVQYAKHPDDRGGWALGHVGPVPEGLVAWFIAGAALIFVCIVLGKRLKREAA
jgi:ubiquinol-cytochrome c reductase cytochrome c subunit